MGPEAAPPQSTCVRRSAERKTSNRHILRSAPSPLFSCVCDFRGAAALRTLAVLAKSCGCIATILGPACSAMAACLEGLLRRHPGQGAKLVGQRLATRGDHCVPIATLLPRETANPAPGSQRRGAAVNLLSNIQHGQVHCKMVPALAHPGSAIRQRKRRTARRITDN